MMLSKLINHSSTIKMYIASYVQTKTTQGVLVNTTSQLAIYFNNIT